MDTIREKHKCLINGLTHLFALFVKAHYISSTDVLYPPQDVDVGRFHRLGFEPEVIDLVQLLPVLRDEAIWGYNEEGVEMIPRAKLVNYLKQLEADVGDDMLQRLRWVDHRDKDRQGIFPPSILRLTFPAFYGVNVLYDVHNQTIIEWCHLNQKQWQDCPRQPCEVFFSKVFEKFNTLEYVPFFDPDGEAEVPIRKIMENPILFQNIWPGGVRLPTDPQAAIQQYGENRDGRDLIRRNINEWRALQKLYRDAGWESEFNGELFDNRRRDLLRMMDDFQDQSSEWSMIPPHRRTQDERIAEREFRQRQDAFWAESAGEYYV
ncbi:hypothetical protein Asppvi_004446 [Aspergillus pseudoviridinutans]|uniref:Uncharacterized protein n=1 Tax=Aspergillus pseudoviridinutans TaxID=1517512 RepID=A0A9P3B6E2_9EURO|nr:uncharacterized protein Asppvi_004446 [Aspergillus pseudoviridinutans]GIJ85587.1 hypothetical protein Asppvi_004446 [Aspergillus pseudoviridinutans]